MGTRRGYSPGRASGVADERVWRGGAGAQAPLPQVVVISYHMAANLKVTCSHHGGSKTR